MRAWFCLYHLIVVADRLSSIVIQDLITGDELMSDTYNIKDVGDGLWEVDCKMVSKGGEDFGNSFRPPYSSQRPGNGA